MSLPQVVLRLDGVNQRKIDTVNEASHLQQGLQWRLRVVLRIGALRHPLVLLLTKTTERLEYLMLPSRIASRHPNPEDEWQKISS